MRFSVERGREVLNAAAQCIETDPGTLRTCPLCRIAFRPKKAWQTLHGRREIPRAPGYFATCAGQIISTKTGREIVLKPQIGTGGYLVVGYWVDGKRHVRSVHLLVTEAFIGPLPEGKQTRHLDGDKGNNRPSNLVYGTRLENAQARDQHGTTPRGERHGNAKLTEADVAQIRVALREGELHWQIAARFHITPGVVSRIKRGLAWTRK